ncbi:Regulator of ribosome biosynthesis [Zancudomyces culisetae]|uniref:Ribosome biogenesis regulatory protein n=1 Tax=Zancudomyces culisetae TaxID=1213189 RepID=A0A1R1PS50_ZANCU|nr:Regulator of ribosome biosynthesis [Zancudomyces culisetae]|eukprot:OMH83749.1 Regulator of ribosome biosynthesis [Zancudomyces culisetae]
MDVQDILKTNAAKFKSTKVVGKVVPVQFQLDLMAAYDRNMIDAEKFNAAKEKSTPEAEEMQEEYLKEISRDVTQLLVNKLFDLPIKKGDNEDGGVAEGPMAVLPKPLLRLNKKSKSMSALEFGSSSLDDLVVLPREKPVPKVKPLTRWEKFAKLKGIQKKKRTKLVYDEDTDKMVPSWGYKGVNKKLEEQWLIPVPDHQSNDFDVRKHLTDNRKERVSKNQRREKRNLEERAATEDGSKSKIVKLSNHTQRKSQIQKVLTLTKNSSTASMGKFDKVHEGEPKTVRRQKQQFRPVVTKNIKDEIQRNKEILAKIKK